MSLAEGMAVSYGVAEPLITDLRGVDNLLRMCGRLGVLCA